MTRAELSRIEDECHIGPVIFPGIEDPTEKLIREIYIAGYDAGQRYMIDRMRGELSLRTFDEHDEFQKIEAKIKARLEAIQELRKGEKDENETD